MRHLLATTVRLPLLLRVVALYVVVGIPSWALISLQPAQQVQASVLPPAKPAVILRESDVRAGQPASITVPRLGIELPVIDGQYDKTTDNWTLSEDKVQFAAMTAIPNNQTGNTFLYGHNTEAVFAPLAQLQAGDEAIVRTTNGLEFRYVFNGVQLVNPDATSILDATQAPTLTLMTCEGIFSEARRVAVFDFKEVL